MNALLLNGAPASGDVTDAVATATGETLGGAGWNVQATTLRDVTVADCTGCFRCWLKTPGECVIDDDGRANAAAFIASDLAVCVTPISFGGYGSLLKSTVDRMVPLVTCFFQKVDGEVHHIARDTIATRTCSPSGCCGTVVRGKATSSATSSPATRSTSTPTGTRRSCCGRTLRRRPPPNRSRKLS
jgi:multimeric flavodoxin WrbA